MLAVAKRFLGILDRARPRVVSVTTAVHRPEAGLRTCRLVQRQVRLQPLKLRANFIEKRFRSKLQSQTLIPNTSLSSQFGQPGLIGGSKIKNAQIIACPIRQYILAAVVDKLEMTSRISTCDLG